MSEEHMASRVLAQGGQRQAETERLADCPFCGSPGLASVHEECGFHIAGCCDADCIAHSVAYDFVSRETAVAAWNTRSALRKAAELGRGKNG